MSVKILKEPELRQAVGIDHASLDCIAECFGWLHDGRAMVPPVAHLDASEHHGEVDIKTAYVRRSIEDLVRRSQVLITVTASRSPLIRADWLHPGLHITAVGADFPGKGELEPAVLERADRLYCDRLEQCRRIGELQHWRGARPLEAYEPGAVVRAAAPGRQSEAEITLCDLTGVGVQDTAIANRACALARGDD